MGKRTKLFEDIEARVIDESIPTNVSNSFLEKFIIGAGDNSVNIEKKKGLWIAGKKYEDALFSVDIVTGEVKAPNISTATNFLPGSGTRTTGDGTGTVAHACGFQPDIVILKSVHLAGGGGDICFGRIADSISDCYVMYAGVVENNASLCLLNYQGAVLDYTGATGDITSTGFELDFSLVYYDVEYTWEAYKLT